MHQEVPPLRFLKTSLGQGFVVGDFDLVDLDVLMERLRKELKQSATGDGSVPAATQPIPSDPQDSRPNGRRHSFAEFKSLDNESFVRNAYLATLGREPDEIGRFTMLHRLESKQIGRASLLLELINSSEGRDHKTEISGLGGRAVAERLRYNRLTRMTRTALRLLRNSPHIANHVRQLASQAATAEKMALRAVTSAETAQRLAEAGAERERGGIEQQLLEQRNWLEKQIQILRQHHADNFEHLKSDLQYTQNTLQSSKIDVQNANNHTQDLIHQIEADLKKIKSEIQYTPVDLNELKSEVRNTNNANHDAINNLISGLQQIKSDIQSTQTDLQKLNLDVQNLNNSNHETVQTLDLDLQRLNLDVQSAQTDLKNLKREAHHTASSTQDLVQSMHTDLTEFNSEVHRKLGEHWRTLVDQKLRIDILMKETRRKISEFQPKQMEAIISEDKHMFDAFYVSFEDRYRGSREDIKNRQRIYIPDIERACATTDNAPVVDIGCGRGEWLELLSEAGFEAKGYDLNRVMVKECEQRRLDVAQADALQVLETLPDDSVTAVTGFHIIEHLPFAELVQLFDQALRTLKSGGLVIFETPNPGNLLVASERFYMDPTHRNPLPVELIAFVAEARGFVAVESRFLHPPADRVTEPFHDAMLDMLRERIYAPQDYAVIGWKA